MPCPTCGENNPPEARFCGKCGARLEQAQVQTGDIIAERYRIVDRIGKGAMGTVYRAEHVQLGKAVAIKLLHRDLEQNAENVARFHREAEAASRLNHPNTIHVFDFGRTQSGSLFLAMEYVDGDDLGKIIDREGPMPFGRVAYICALVTGSVADAHAAGVIHRDLKPENIVIASGRDEERPKVLDFGLAKLFEGSLGTQITGAGTIVGTPYYMSPEQIQGKELDPRSDVYSIGAIMYECVVGKPPFEAPSPVGILTKHLSEKPAAPSTRSPISVPLEADEIILRCLEKDPDDRFQTAEELRQALIDYLTTVGSEDWRMAVEGRGASSKSGMRRFDDFDRAPRRKRRPWLWVGLLAFIAVGVGAWQWSHRGPSEREPNHLLGEATPLPPDVDMEAYLGKRVREDMGDVDVFEIRHSGAERSGEIEVSSIPNMDVVVEVLRADDEDPIIAADSRGLGLGERLPNVPLEPGRYFVRVREKRGTTLPTENVSDPYAIRWSPLPDDDSFEQEPNDSLEQAELLSRGTERRAWIGWNDDVDTFCLEEDGDAIVAQVSALAEVDLVLRVVDRATERSRKIDEKSIGRGETSEPQTPSESGALCIEVSVDRTEEGGRVAQPDATYGVRFIQAPSR